jgi:hypothetical protein
MAAAKTRPAKVRAAKKKPAKLVNKSQAIREALTQFPDVSRKRIIEILKKRGIDVTPQRISTVKYKMKTEGPKNGAVTNGRRPHSVSLAERVSKGRRLVRETRVVRSGWRPGTFS